MPKADSLHESQRKYMQTLSKQNEDMRLTIENQRYCTVYHMYELLLDMHSLKNKNPYIIGGIV